MPWSQVRLLRSPAGSWLSVLTRAAWTVIECCAGRWSCLVKRVCRSTRVPIPERWFGPDDQCNGRYCLVVWRFRRRSRRPGQRSAYHNRSVTPAGHVSDPTRSSSDRNRGELGRTGRRSSGGTSLAVPSFGRNVVPFFQICAADRLTPTSMAATRNGTPWAICQLHEPLPCQRLRPPTQDLRDTTSGQRVPQHGFTLHRSLETSPPPLNSPRDHPLNKPRSRPA